MNFGQFVVRYWSIGCRGWRQQTDFRRVDGEATMGQIANVNPITEHAIFLRLFITNGGGW